MNNTVSQRAQTAAGVARSVSALLASNPGSLLATRLSQEKVSSWISSRRACSPCLFLSLLVHSLWLCVCTCARVDTHLSLDIFPSNCWKAVVLFVCFFSLPLCWPKALFLSRRQTKQHHNHSLAEALRALRKGQERTAIQGDIYNASRALECRKITSTWIPMAMLVLFQDELLIVNANEQTCWSIHPPRDTTAGRRVSLPVPYWWVVLSDVIIQQPGGIWSLYSE